MTRFRLVLATLLLLLVTAGLPANAGDRQVNAAVPDCATGPDLVLPPPACAGLVEPPAPAPRAAENNVSPVTGCDLPIPKVDDRCEEWIHTYEGPAGDEDLAGAEIDGFEFVTVSPDSTTAFTAAMSDVLPGNGVDLDLVLVAIDQATGERRWDATVTDPGRDGYAHAVVVDPLGERVFLVGRGRTPDETCWGSYTVVAFDATTGTEQWATHHDDGRCVNLGMVVPSPDGSTIYMVGSLREAGGPYRGFVAAIDAGTGSILWENVDEPGPFAAGTSRTVLALSPAGDELIAFGGGMRSDGSFPRTIAWVGARLDAASGSSLSTFLWDVPRPDTVLPANAPAGIGVDPEGARFYLVGGVEQTAQRSLDITVLAMDWETAEVEWMESYDGPRDKTSFDSVWYQRPLRIAPDGETVYVAGYGQSIHGAMLSYDFITLAFDASTGAEEWATRYTSENYLNWVPSVGVSVDGSEVYVSGSSRFDAAIVGGRYTTLAYDSATGEERWVARHTDGYSFQSGMSVAPDGSRIVVTGTSAGFGTGPSGRTDYDVLTLAYEASPMTPPEPEGTRLTFTERSETSGQYSDEAVFEARLEDSDGSPIGGEELTFEITGDGSARSFAATTDADGVGSVVPTLTEEPGLYRMTARYAGDDERTGSEASTDLVIGREDTETSLTVAGRGGDMTLEARLSDLDSPERGIEGRTIDFYSDSEPIGTGHTDRDGVASVSVPPEHRGANRVYEAVFSGDDFYLASSDERASRGPDDGSTRSRSYLL